MRQGFLVALFPLLLLIALPLVSVRSVPETDLLPLQTYRNHDALASPPFPVVERASRAIRDRDGIPAMVAFLTGHVNEYPDDSNNGYYLSIIGDLYRDQGAQELARQYYRRALLRYPDVYVRDVPTHRVSINRLLTIVEDPRERIEYLHYLQDHYREEIDRGLIAYYLGRSYEEAGRWSEAIESFRVFLSYPSTDVPGEPNARHKIQRRVAFYDSNRNWTHRDLDTLVSQITNALWSQNAPALLRYRAGENFFTMSWHQDEMDPNSDIPTFDIGAFLRRSRVRYSSELELNSNANEAYLRTWGWSHRIPTWYLYFRRIDFPADPEVHGNWEWGGILFGEAF